MMDKKRIDFLSAEIKSIGTSEDQQLEYLTALSDALNAWNLAPKNILADLEEYLLRRESDIAFSIEDLGALRRVFEHIIGRPPEG